MHSDDTCTYRTRGVYKNITNIEENVIVVDVVIFPNSVDTTCYLIYVRTSAGAYIYSTRINIELELILILILHCAQCNAIDIDIVYRNYT